MVSQPVKASTTGDSDAGDMSQERNTHAELALAVRRNLLANESAERIAKLFSVLSDPTRLQVLYALLNAPRENYVWVIWLPVSIETIPPSPISCVFCVTNRLSQCVK